MMNAFRKKHSFPLSMLFKKGKPSFYFGMIDYLCGGEKTQEAIK
jgi:hypothetical protein